MTGPTLLVARCIKNAYSGQISSLLQSRISAQNAQKSIPRYNDIVVVIHGCAGNGQVVHTDMGSCGLQLRYLRILLKIVRRSWQTDLTQAPRYRQLQAEPRGARSCHGHRRRRFSCQLIAMPRFPSAPAAALSTTLDSRAASFPGADDAAFAAPPLQSGECARE